MNATNRQQPAAPKKEDFPSLLTPRNGNASAASNATSSRFSVPSSFDGAAALRSFMLSHANFSMTARAALAAAAAAGMSFGDAARGVADLAPAFDLWSRGPSPEVTQREWVDFYAAVHRTGARAYWKIGKRAGPGAVAPECCGEKKEVFSFLFSGLLSLSSDAPAKNSLVLSLSLTSPKINKKTGILAPGLVEIARALPPQWGSPPIALPLARAEADAVRFDSDGDARTIDAASR